MSIAESEKIYKDTPIPFGNREEKSYISYAAVKEVQPGGSVYAGGGARAIPQKILEMRRLYQYGAGSFREKCQNFYRQGKFMEDYEDEAPLPGPYRHYFTTYHDLNTPQLRGYFTWRKKARNGEFLPIAASFAYVYLYELLCGIGTSSPEDSLRRMQEFETGFLDAGYGDERMRANLHHWEFESCVVHNLPEETAEQFADRKILRRDRSLTVLKDPGDHSDEEIMEALACLDEDKILQSPVMRDYRETGVRLLASLWRIASERPMLTEENLFAACFGEAKEFPWHPFANAIYWEPYPKPDMVYELKGGCRVYRYTRGDWHVVRYDRLSFDQERFHGLLHEADAVFRRYLKAGRYLHDKESEQWAKPFAMLAVEQERRAAEKAARPKISIDLSSLGRIRADADVTRDSLLTEEERQEMNAAGQGQAAQPGQYHLPEPALFSEGSEEQIKGEETGSAARGVQKHSDSNLKPAYREILQKLLRGESVSGMLKAQHQMASVVADAINEALYDDIGDNVVECDGEAVTLVEDYRDDVAQLLA